MVVCWWVVLDWGHFLCCGVVGTFMHWEGFDAVGMDM